MINEVERKEQRGIQKDLLESDMKTTKDIIKFAKKQGLSVKETKEMIQANSMKDIETFMDSNGVKREIPKEVAQMWKSTFGLESLNDVYIPQFSKEVKEALHSVLNGKDIELRFGSLMKLINKNRLDIMPKIKEVLESPNKVLDNGRGILFIKEFVDSDKNRYFMSVAKNYNGEWILSSHVRRELPNINNEIKRSKILYDRGFKGE